MSGLTTKQAAFVEEYLKDFNATKAAQRAGYSGVDSTLAATGSRLLKNDKVAEKVAQRLCESAMSTDEALRILAEQIRADVADCLGDDGLLSVTELKEAGLGHLIKSTTPMKEGVKVELYDKQYALNLILKAGGAYLQRIDVTSGGKPLILRVKGFDEV